MNLEYFCNPDSIESNALAQVQQYAQSPYIRKVCAFTDLHFCDEKALPAGVAFESAEAFYPLVTGKDIGCGVMYLRISKADWLRPFDKQAHYRALHLAHTRMTDDGLGGGNHFLSLEEDDTHVYILCHTGTRDRGIALYQHGYGLVQQFSQEYGRPVAWLPLDRAGEAYRRMYAQVLAWGHARRKSFCLKTLIFLQQAQYVRSDRAQIPQDYLRRDYASLPETGCLHGTDYVLADSVHNHLRFREDGTVVHRKGSTELVPGQAVVIPLSMSRGSLLVQVQPRAERAADALMSCAHGAGRRLSRFDAMRHWKHGLREKERRAYRAQFSEMLDRSGEFPAGYLQEMDFAYKDAADIFLYQPYLKRVTQTRPIVTVKYTEI